MDRLLSACDEIGDLLDLKISTGIMGGIEARAISIPAVQDADQLNMARRIVAQRWKLKDVLANGVQDARSQLK